MGYAPGFQQMAAILRALRLHHARLGVPDVETIDDVRVTTPLRTLIDMIVDGAIAPELQVQTLAQAIAVG